MNDLVSILLVKRSLKEFFGKEIEILPLPRVITQEKLNKCKGLGFSLHFLPQETVSRDKIYPGWKKIIQEDWFYEDIEIKNLSPETLMLPGRWILIDHRPKPMFKNGRQMYLDDEKFLSPIVKKLRKFKKIDPRQISVNVPLNSRFGITPDEYDRFLRPELSKLLDFKIKQIRLPRAIEWNYLANYFYLQWGKTNTWEWFDDKKENGLRRLCGGCSDEGGAANVYWNSNYIQFNCIGFRPLIEL